MEAVKGLSETVVSALRYGTTSGARFEVIDVVSSLIRPKSRILDIGCGTGAMTRVLKDTLDADVLGIEPNPERADAARQAGLDIVCGLYGPDIPARHGKFDYIVLADVIEHLEDPGALLVSLYDALTEDGRIVASVPNVAHWTVRLALMRGRFDYQPTGIMDATHLRWFTRDSLSRLFIASGFDIEVFTHTAGSWMHDYKRFPFSLLSEEKRPYVINALATRSHGLFACQHIVSAKRTA